MKAFIKITALFLLQFSVVYANGGQPPPPPLFVSTEITGPPLQAPLFFADTNSVTFFTQVSFYTPSSLDGKISVEGTRAVSSPDQNGKNFEWKLPTAAFNGGIALKIWKSFELFFTLKLDNRENELSLSGSDMGMSFLISSTNDLRVRLDFGLSYNNPDAKILLLDPYSYYNDTTYVTKTSTNKDMSPFVSLTMQYAAKDWIVNPYVQISYCRFPLFDIEDSRGEIWSVINIFSVTPGITYRLSDVVMLSAGGSYFIPSEMENRSSQGIFSGFVQANFLF